MSVLHLEIGNGRPGPRLYVRGRRWHHGRFGAFLTCLGAVLMLHDRHDWPWPTLER
jgi:hypothetical protein